MRTLFLGNSHTYKNDLPELFRQICESHGISMQVTMLCRGGIGFEDHASAVEQTRFNILYGQYDFVVLQHRAHPMGDLAAMRKGAETLLSWIGKTGSIPIFYETWAKKGDEAYQPTMSGIYEALGREFHVKVAPVGDRWQEYRRNHPDAELFAPDGEHATPEGSRLAADVIFHTVFPDQP